MWAGRIPQHHWSSNGAAAVVEELKKYQVTPANTLTEMHSNRCPYIQQWYMRKTPTNTNYSSHCYSYLNYAMILSHLSVS